MVIAIGHNRRRARSSSFTTPSDSSSGNYGAGRTLVVSLLQLHFFFRICFIIYIKPYRYLTIWPSELLDFGLLAIQTSDFWLSGLQTSRLWISGLHTIGHLDFWQFGHMPCLDQDIFGIPCRLHQSQIPNVLPGRKEQHARRTGVRFFFLDFQRLFLKTNPADSRYIQT